jgi:hypothetical protein
MKTATALLGVVLVVGALTGCATVNVWGTRIVTGQVTNASGQPVAGSPVVVVGRSLELSILRMQYEERGRQDVKAFTNAEGRYRIEFMPAKIGNDFTLFFYADTGFDWVKYRRSEPLDIGDRLKGDRPVVVDHVLQFQPTWPEVERQIAYYGAQTERGRILRKHGLPDKREGAPGGGGADEVWWYSAEGVSYRFSGDTFFLSAYKTYIFQSDPTAHTVIAE